MPRGYLKHNQNIARRLARGGSSASNNIRKTSKQHPSSRHSNSGDKELHVFYDDLAFRHDHGGNLHSNNNTISADYNDDDDYAIHQQKNGRCNNTDGKTTMIDDGGHCSICLDDQCASLIHIMNTCRQHSSACYECLRQHYVVQGQKDVSNYPLRCFHPDCDKIVRGSQLEKHGLFRSDDEKTRHYRMVELAKSYKTRGKTLSSSSPTSSASPSLSPTSSPSSSMKHVSAMKVAHCPFCDHPRLFTDSRSHRAKNRRSLLDDSPRVFSCKSCTKAFAVADSFSATIDAVEAFTEDEHGYADEGWVRCPGCHIIISKGDGCWHMTCVCGDEFYWDDEMEKKAMRKGRKKYTLANIV